MRTGSKRNAASPSAAVRTRQIVITVRGGACFNAYLFICGGLGKQLSPSSGNRRRRGAVLHLSTRATATVNNYNRESGRVASFRSAMYPTDAGGECISAKMGMHTSIEPDRGNKSSGPARITHSSKPFVSQCSWQPTALPRASTRSLPLLPEALRPRCATKCGCG